MTITTTDRRDLRRRVYDATEIVRNPYGYRARLTTGAILVLWDQFTRVEIDNGGFE